MAKVRVTRVGSLGQGAGSSGSSSTLDYAVRVLDTIAAVAAFFHLPPQPDSLYANVQKLAQAERDLETVRTTLERMGTINGVEQSDVDGHNALRNNVFSAQLRLYAWVTSSTEGRALLVSANVPVTAIPVPVTAPAYTGPIRSGGTRPSMPVVLPSSTPGLGKLGKLGAAPVVIAAAPAAFPWLWAAILIALVIVAVGVGVGLAIRLGGETVYSVAGAAIFAVERRIATYQRNSAIEACYALDASAREACVARARANYPMPDPADFEGFRPTSLIPWYVWLLGVVAVGAGGWYLLHWLTTPSKRSLRGTPASLSVNGSSSARALPRSALSRRGDDGGGLEV